MNKAPSNTQTEQETSLHDSDETAKWFCMGKRAFLENVRRKRIPAVRINSRVLRFHWPTVLAALQKGTCR